MKRKLIYITGAVLLLGIFLYVSRGPNISNALKRIILPELEAATGRKFIAQQIYVNLFPLFAEIKGLKSFDDKGDKFVEIRRVKGYIGLTGLLERKLYINRLVLKEADVLADRQQLDEIAANIKRYLARETKMPIKVVVKSVSLQDAAIMFHDDDYKLSAIGLNADAVLGKTPKFILSSKKVSFDKKGFQDAQASLEAVFQLKDKLIDLKKFRLMSYNSELRTSGFLDAGKFAGKFLTEATLYMDTLKKLLGLQRSGEGRLTVTGSLGFEDLKSGIGSLFADVKIRGDLFVETLMELLQVKEKIAGHLNVDGFLKGPLNKPYAEGKAVLENGDLFGVPVEKLNCRIVYRDGAMRFLDGTGNILHGTAVAEGMIRLPVVNYFEVKVKAADVSSEGLLKLVGLHGILSEGKVSGTLASSGHDFDPVGQFSYRRTVAGRDVLGRVKDVKSMYRMKAGVLSFEQMLFSSDKSRLSATGALDLNKNTLSFRGEGETKDIGDLTSPYFGAVSGPARWSYVLSGSVSDPVIDTHFDAQRTTVATRSISAHAVRNNGDYIFDTVRGTASYRKKQLTLKYFSAESANEKIKAEGDVFFPRASKLFDLRKPDFNLSVSVRDADMRKVSGLVGDKLTLEGVLNTDFRLSGGMDTIKLAGDVHGSNMTIAERFPVNTADGRIVYENGSWNFKALRLRNGESVVDMAGTFGPHNKFSIDAAGKTVRVSDIMPQKNRESLKSRYKELFAGNFFDTISISNVDLKGHGTFDSPVLSLRSDVNAGAYRGRPLGKGDIKADLDGKHFTMTARLQDKKLAIRGEAQLTDKLPWSASADFNSARLEFIAANFLKDVPDDLLVNLKGNITAQGDKDHINAYARIDEAHLYLYGTGFANSSGIRLSLEDKKVSVGSFSMKSETSEFRMTGTATIGTGYDLLFEGSSSLSPLKAFSRNIDIIKGNASFVCSLTGDWNKPKINGDMDVSNGAIGFKNIRYRLSAVNAYLYFDEDRIILDRASGKLSGGDITATGTAYTEKFKIKRFMLNSHLRHVTASVSKDFLVSFDADLNYRGTLDAQTILGDVDVKRAKYTERVEWKSWLLGFRQKERPKVESSRLDNAGLNVRIAGSNLVIDNNVAKASAKMDVLLTGTVAAPVVLGKVEAKEGLVYFRNNEFKILQTTVDFSNPNQIIPYFTIIAETKVRNYNIRLSLNGYVDQFNLALSSDPFLAEGDIFSLLTVGQLGKNVRGLEGGIGAGEATSFLTGKMQDVVEERLRTITGLDRLSIEPSVSSRSALTTTSSISKSTGTVSPRVTISKRLLGDKLYVTYSAASGSGEEQVWKLEYLLSQHMSLIGERDELGSLGGDIKFRFGFK
ncbi:MAG: translocation/assembly module TamB domain-containing protein [Nitrospirae bacterium]|nr:translocation/assembly module TamB domain-containing protein [Nitrospirota bacterium]